MLLGGQVKVKTQKCPLDLATLLSLRGGLLSRSYSGKDTNRGKDKTAGTRRQGSSSLEEGDICVGMEEMSSEVQRTSWAWRLGIPAKLKRSMQQNITFQKGQMPRKANVMQL